MSYATIFIKRCQQEFFIFYPFNFVDLQINPPLFVGNKQTPMYRRRRTGGRPEDRQEEGNF